MCLTWAGFNKCWPLTSGRAEGEPQNQDLLQLSAIGHANSILSNISPLRVCFQPPVWRWIFIAHLPQQPSLLSHSHKRGISDLLCLIWESGLTPILALTVASIISARLASVTSVISPNSGHLSPSLLLRGSSTPLSPPGWIVATRSSPRVHKHEHPPPHWV